MNNNFKKNRQNFYMYVWNVWNPPKIVHSIHATLDSNNITSTCKYKWKNISQKSISCVYIAFAFVIKKRSHVYLLKAIFFHKGETTYVPNPFNPPLGGTGSSKKGSSSTSLPPSKSTSAFGFLRWSFRLDWRFRWFFASTNSFLSFVWEYKITRYITKCHMISAPTFNTTWKQSWCI